MSNKVPAIELESRMQRFRTQMNQQHPQWELSVVFNKINLYYFTGTMQEGMLFIPRNDEAVLWIKRSYERAVDESLFPRIRQMESYRDAAAATKVLLPYPAVHCHLNAYYPPAPVQAIHG